ncbi:MAG: tRNA (adenosine(37)-N6)-threonylcarbamoyltransferase complex dimerization subunit type 1 TsaB [Oscillospiraceae bacterium]|nr:tRNA (adenosine(37)-N6)-threonylcarbamoyltransferase complex dimerization subunit type 1 TsaB [Oscillospiraceae bacterium]
MIRLGLDASQRVTSCAVSDDSGIVSVLTMDKPIENFTILIQKTLAQAKISITDIDEIVVCIGPGSQMGVRTTVVTGNALGMALSVPVTGVLSTDALAIASPHYEAYLVAVSAGKRRWYVTEYNWNKGKLQHLDNLKLLDEIPLVESPILRFDCFDADKAKVCACGILEVVNKQSHLVKQLRLAEVVPYEYGN